MTRYIAGSTNGRLKWTDKPLRRCTPTDLHGKPFRGDALVIGDAGSPDIVRGIAKESTWREGGVVVRYFAREMPEDGYAAVDDIERQIRDLQEVGRKLLQERQELLHALAPRGKRIKAPV